MPTSSRTTSCLLYAPRPALIPAANHQRGCPRSRARTANRITSSQTTRSTVAVDSRWPADEHQRTAGAGGGEHLGAPAAAELTGEQNDEEQDRQGTQDRRDPDAPQMVAEQRDAQLRQQRRERWLVNVTPRGVSGQHPEVELVAVVPYRSMVATSSAAITAPITATGGHATPDSDRPFTTAAA
jgi:hypothetical protein